MTKLVNRAKMTTATTGTGTITLGSAVDGYQTFADAGVVNSDVVRYVIEDGDAWEIGLGTYTASGTTLTRGSIESSNSDNALNLTGNAVVYVSAAAADLQELVDFADNFVLPTADGSTGQVLTTNGAGTLSFSTISGYTDADVDTHLNTGTASSGEVLSWTGSDYDWITAGGAFSVIGTRNLAAIATLPALTTGTDNFVAGQNSGLALTSGSRNVAIGESSLRSMTTQQRTIAVGADAGRLTTGGDNVFVGDAVGYNVTSGTYNIGIGSPALYGGVAGLTGAQNVAIGTSAGNGLTTGNFNFLGGRLAGTAITTGSNNVAIGNGALDAATTGGRNIAIGQDAMGSGVATAASGNNVAIGYLAGYDITSAVDNVLVGHSAGENVTTGGDNIGIGRRAIRNVTTGTLNVAIGANALSAGTATATSSGTAIGFNTLANATGDFNTALGRNAGLSLGSGTNNTIIGYNADTSSATVSNEITLGNSSITNLRVPGVGFQFDTTDGLIVPKTVTAGGTTGAQTINKTAGTVNFAAAATSLVVTNSFVDANSIIIATVGTDDVTMKSVAVVAAAGSFTLYANAAATAETRVNWFVAN